MYLPRRAAADVSHLSGFMIMAATKIGRPKKTLRYKKGRGYFTTFMEGGKQRWIYFKTHDEQEAIKLYAEWFNPPAPG